MLGLEVPPEHLALKRAHAKVTPLKSSPTGQFNEFQTNLPQGQTSSDRRWKIPPKISRSSAPYFRASRTPALKRGRRSPGFNHEDHPEAEVVSTNSMVRSNFHREARGLAQVFRRSHERSVPDECPFPPSTTSEPKIRRDLCFGRRYEDFARQPRSAASNQSQKAPPMNPKPHELPPPVDQLFAASESIGPLESKALRANWLANKGKQFTIYSQCRFWRPRQTSSKDSRA